ncbi:RNA polymerase Rpb2, domain 7 [Haematococcus lacustris]|uniref:RNA polymerase Rpb2, domain 7 n=1 Tax=Haematococcus lacustris TaxID=44745 RepID=A0A699ZDK2_HAELA|nr:RNA polymerase Rpb2, domain 7 [Haematococcus lacustris]
MGSTGPINNLTKQPSEGRKLGGGIRSRYIERVAVPYVFKFLATELAAMDIKVHIEAQ